VQRAVIVLRAKDIPFEVTYIDLRNKPDWFLEISPHGKVPVLQVDGVPLFESNAIAEYLDEAETPRLHPEDLVKRARNRAWTDFLTTFTGGLSGIYYSKNPEDSEERIAMARARLDKLEEAIAKERGNNGPFFNGPALSLVDAGYAPFLMRFTYVDQWLNTGLLDDYPLVSAWAEALLASDVVTGSVPDNFYAEFRTGLKRRGFHVGTLMENQPEAAAAGFS
jgi:glutathione S-transferase